MHKQLLPDKTLNLLLSQERQSFSPLPLHELQEKWQGLHKLSTGSSKYFSMQLQLKVMDRVLNLVESQLLHELFPIPEQV